MNTEEEVPFDVGDERQVSKRKTKAELERERQVEELRVILSTEGGRNVVWRVLAMSQIFNSPPADTNDAFRMVGRQDLGRELLNEIFTSDKDAFILMQTEGNERDSKIGKAHA